MSTCRFKRFKGVLASCVIALMTASFMAAAPAEARDLSGGVKGLVLDAQTGKGVAGVRVFVMEKTYPWGETLGGQDWNWTPIAESVTGKSGAYSMKLSTAGTYRVFFVPADRERYAMEAYPNDAVPEAGDDVVVRYGRTTSGISVKLDPSKRIEGHLYAAESRWDGVDGSLGLPGVTVQACFQGLVQITCMISDTMFLGEATTDASGFFSIPGFKEFAFFAWANPGFPEGTFRPDLSSLMVNMSEWRFPDGVKNSDAFLQDTSLANITGRLVDQNGFAVADKDIEVYELDQSEAELAFMYKCTVTTDAEGRFGVSSGASCLNLWEPAALLRFPGDGEYQGEFYDNADWEGEAQQIPVDWGRTHAIGDWVVWQNTP